MASSKSSLIFLALFCVLLLPFVVHGDHDDDDDHDHDPLDHFYDHVCEEVECGKGKCKADIVYQPFNYICECDDGWRRTRDPEDDDDLRFLPCIIPNCTMNYGNCQPAPPPVPHKKVPHNISFYDPCYWIYCGEGTCTRNESYTHTCTCKSGFHNLLDERYFPCYSDCTIGSDCSRLGIKVASQKASVSATGDGSNQGSSILPGKYQWMIMLLISMFIMVTWK